MYEISEITPAMTSEETNTVDTPMGGLPIDDLLGMHQSYRLDGRNYVQWAQLVKTFLKGRGKLHHLTDPGPKASDSKFPAWDIEDSMAMEHYAA